MRAIIFACVLAVLPGGPLRAEEPVQFVRFSPIIVSILDNSRIAGLLSITVHAQAPDNASRDLAEKLRPRLQDAFTRTVLELGELYIAPDRKIDFDLVASAMQAAANRAAPQAKLKIFIYDASTRKS